MSTAALLVFGATVTAYAASTGLFVGHLAVKRLKLAQYGLYVLAAGLVLHAAEVTIRFVEHGAVPVKGPLEALNILALAVGMVFVGVARRYGVPVLGAFAAPVCLVSAIVSVGLSGGDQAVLPEALRSAWFPFHLSFAIAGDALFATAAAVAVAYLMQSRLLQKKKLASGLFQKLPPLHVLDEIIHRLIALGWAASTVGIVAGSFFAKWAWGEYWSWDPKQTAALVTWLLFAGILHARFVVGWQGRRTALMTVGAAVLMLVAFLVLPEVLDSRHGGEYQ